MPTTATIHIAGFPRKTPPDEADPTSPIIPSMISMDTILWTTMVKWFLYTLDSRSTSFVCSSILITVFQETDHTFVEL